MLWDPNPETLARAYDHTRLAVDLDPKAPHAQAVLCWMQPWRKQGEAAIAAGWRAVQPRSEQCRCLFFLSFALAVSERGEEALHNIIKAMRLTPHPSAFYQTALGLCYFVLEEYGLAIAACRRGVEMTDGSIPNHYWLCLVYTLLGRDEEARVEREKLMELTGGRKPVIQHIWLNEDLGFRMHGLARLAGLE